MEAISAAVKDGFFAAGYFAYELGYALEPRLKGLMPASPFSLLWFGFFRSEQRIEQPPAKEWFEHHITGRAYAGPLSFALAGNEYAERFSHVRDYIFSGDVYQVCNRVTKWRF